MRGLWWARLLNNVVSIFSAGAAAGDFESIATVTVGSGGATNVEFTNIPNTYTHLQIRAINRGTTNSAPVITINNDSSVYNEHFLQGNGSTVYAGYESGTLWSYILGGQSVANVFNAGIIDILDYANTNKYKTFRQFGGVDFNNAATGSITFESGLYRSTSAISSIKFTPNTGLIAQYSHFALYGIKAA